MERTWDKSWETGRSFKGTQPKYRENSDRY